MIRVGDDALFFVIVGVKVDPSLLVLGQLLEKRLVAFVHLLPLLVQIFELRLVSLEISDRLIDKCLELLEHNDAIHSLFSWHLNRINRHDLHILGFYVLWSLV